MKKLFSYCAVTNNLATYTLLLFTAVTFLSIRQPFSVHAGNPYPPCHVLIESAHQSGRIDFEMAQLYKAYSLFAPSLLPDEFRSPTPGKCGTPILLELQQNCALLSPETQNILRDYGIRPLSRAPRIHYRPALSGPEQTEGSTNFLVHYTLSGEDAVPADDSSPANGIPDFVDMVLQEMEYVWNEELTTMGWLQPPSDNGGGGGDAKYDIYLEESGYYGYCDPEGGWRGDNPNSTSVIETSAYYSYLSMDNDFAGFPNTPLQNIQVTGAHEFNHAIQFGYDGSEMLDFLWEGIATWAEDEVYDDVNDNLQYLEVPDTCLPYNDVYSTWIFFRYLSEHYGGQTTVRSVWENAVTSDGLDALSNAISGAGADMATVFPGFSAANLLLSVCPQNAPYCYEEADLYISYLTIASEDTIHYTGDTVSYTGSAADHYSADYVALDASGTIEILFQSTDTGTSFGVNVIGTSGGSADVLPVSLSGSPPAGTAALDADNYDSIQLVIANLTKTSALPWTCSHNSYTITVRELTTSSSSTTTIICPAEEIYGEYAEESELLRNVRDGILNNTPEGQELIRLYYEWSPVVVKAIEEDEEFKEEVKEMVDGFLGLVGK
jgi:hypothetical protein